jgi:hypothetical protein
MTNSWAYSFIVWDGKEGLRIEDSTWKVADVNEKTGNINIYGTAYTINVIESNNPWNESIYPRITLLNNKKEEVFFETIKSNSNSSVRVVNGFEWIEDYWMFIKFSDTQNYTYILNPENLEFNPWVLAIYRAGANTFEELFIVFPDWRINTLNQNYYLSYSTFEDYVVLILTDKHFGREVARVLYKVDADYVVN